LTEKHGLYIAGGKENVNRQQLRDPDSVKYAIYDAVKTASPECKSWGDLEKRLARDGIAVTFKYSGGTDIRQGVIFGKDGFSFNGSKIDRAFSFSKLDTALNANAQRQESRETRISTAQEKTNVSAPTPERATVPSLTPSPQPNHGHRVEPQHGHGTRTGISSVASTLIRGRVWKITRHGKNLARRKNEADPWANNHQESSH
jgi:hypothetical protein